jgi:DNA excision repair protein ERCC-4
MKIIIDTREQQSYQFTKNAIQTERAALPVGDYSLEGFIDRVAVERKSLDDMVGCLLGKERDRFERELARAGSYERFVVVIEASLHDVSRGHYRSQMQPHSALQSITAFYIRYGIPFLFCGDRAGGEYITYSILQKYLSEIEKRFDQLRKGG